MNSDEDGGLSLDEYGLLTNSEDWNTDLAVKLARLNGINELTAEHWKLINALREYYFQFSVAPPISKLCRELGMTKTCGQELFNTCLTAWRVAGLPDPGEEAKSYLSGE